MPSNKFDDQAEKLSEAARTASRQLAKSESKERSLCLENMAKNIRSQRATILRANLKDLEEAEKKGLSDAMLDRLTLSEARLEDIAASIESIATSKDPIGLEEDPSTQPSGIRVTRMRIPLGVICMIYESRPNVTADAAALCIRSGNAVILRGGKEAIHSNRALAEAIREAISKTGLPENCVQLVQETDRALMGAILQREEEIDLVIPRGGEGLIRYVSEHSRIPVLKHYKGVCHVYVHTAAKQEMALRICENAKAQRPGVCNAAETILVDEAIAPEFVPALASRFAQIGVEIRGDERVCALGADLVTPAIEADWGSEFLAKIISVAVVADLDEAVAHIECYGSNHTEAIVTEDQEVANQFLREVGSSTVLVNASTRFADGGQLGLGAEMGISTTRMHAYGPMGVLGLTTTKFVVRGTGQVRI